MRNRKIIATALILFLVIAVGSFSSVIMAQEDTESDFNFEDYISNAEELDSAEKEAILRTLGEYQEEISQETLKDLTDSYISGEMGAGQTMVIAKNLSEDISEEETEDGAELEDSYKDIVSAMEDSEELENSEQLKFQTALELRKISQEEDSELTEEFSEEIQNQLEDGSLHISDIKKLSADLRNNSKGKEKDKEENENEIAAQAKEKNIEDIKEQAQNNKGKVKGKDKDKAKGNSGGNNKGKGNKGNSSNAGNSSNKGKGH